MYDIFADKTNFICKIFLQEKQWLLTLRIFTSCKKKRFRNPSSLNNRNLSRLLNRVYLINTIQYLQRTRSIDISTLVHQKSSKPQRDSRMAVVKLQFAFTRIADYPTNLCPLCEAFSNYWFHFIYQNILSVL